jgi:hypothetical protein
MCESPDVNSHNTCRTIPVQEAVGTALAHDITEIRPGDFKGRAFKKGHIIKKEDICRLQKLGKDQVFVLNITGDDMHEDDAALAMARALLGNGVKLQGEPKEGKINIVADRKGLFKVDKEALFKLNMLGEVMCASIHNNTVVKKGQVLAGTRAIPLVVKKEIVDKAVSIAEEARRSDSGGRIGGVIEVRKLRKPKTGIVISGNEVYYGRIKDAFAPVIKKKISNYGGEVVGTYYAPDDARFIEERLRDLINAGADLLITTGGMSVDPDDVTRFAISSLGAHDITYGSAVLPGAMFLIAYLSNSPEFRSGQYPEQVTVMGVPACAMYHKITVFDMILPRVLAGEKITREDLAELGHGGLCLDCDECRYPICPFVK